ncbi:hypothetical protein PAXRUDRAFT_157925 [Paxillus rubicundulus Ve08.2h10]|uniref:Uncharacterized protein n=1 Tax=Paxillus rubicundulus Ve08.2h10 TaxID=930991 RepID=A0A0D0DPA6_9AGAM|nr:hypothetical protein PAXRUDRAFT_157925 [Paxillus rubicundulus Ve08.2h10]
MSHPVTHAKNANQHPGQAVLDLEQKKRTSEQKRADDAQAKTMRKGREAAHQHGIDHLASIMDKSAQKEVQLLTTPAKPRPRP